jgi:Na+-translocating ferredoxin:NAD+ oxidoreductase subunit C
MFKRIPTFRGGIKLPGKKELSKNEAIEQAPAPKVAIIPLLQHAGAAALPRVAVGQRVMRGERIGEKCGAVSSPVHSSISGTVIAIKEIALPGENKSQAIFIENDHQDTTVFLDPIEFDNAEPSRLLGRIDEAGIVGLGGAAFPARIKLTVPSGKNVDCLLVNGNECEPYLTVDFRLMVERAAEVARGVRVLLRVLNISRAIVGIEQHSRPAIEAMKEALASEAAISVLPLKVKYPQGAERMFIKAALGRMVPSGGLPSDVGVIVQNVGTALAVYEAVCKGRPLVDRVVTVSGEAIARPKNLLVRIGTPIGDLINACGGITMEKATVIMGGPMTGTAVGSLDFPVIKGTSGIVVLPHENQVIAGDVVCIRCGRCFNACPQGLKPFDMAELDGPGLIDEAKKLNVLDCCACGVCSVVCPAGRHNSGIIRKLKASVMKNQINDGAP